MENRYITLRFRTPIDSEDQLQGYLLTRTEVAGIEEAADGTFLYYLPKEDWSESFQKNLAEFLSTQKEISFLGADVLEERDWNAEWEQSIEPLVVTPELVVAPSWKLEEAKSIPYRFLITIDPKMSFGTGHHETTRLCLRALEHVPTEGRRVLDIGTGSGVLAIYALLRGAERAVGIDTDPWSIENTVENRELNRISAERFEVRPGRLDETVAAREQFELILANIYRNVLIDIASDIARHCTPGASVVLSGLLVYDVDEVRRAYEAIGFTRVTEMRENEWACLTLTLEACA